MFIKSAALMPATAEQTALTGQVRTEINCLPVENKDYVDYMKRRAKEESESKPKIHVLNASVGGNTLQPGILGATVDTSAFIVRVFTSYTYDKWTDWGLDKSCCESWQEAGQQSCPDFPRRALGPNHEMLREVRLLAAEVTEGGAQST